VIIAATNIGPAHALADEINAAGGYASAMSVDVADRKAVNDLFENVLAVEGAVDILVNNAGGSARGSMTHFCDSDPSTWDRVLGVNLMGVFHTCRAAVNHMLERGSGCIINIGSVAGMTGFAYQVDYSAAKGAVIAFTQALAKETTAKGVRVNCISPGPISSDAAQDIPSEMRSTLAKSDLEKSTGFHRFGDPDDIAHLAVLLASNEGKFISGQNYPVCGLMNLGLISPISD
jgi:NAD(P)-dependent dehydrogenase (short-subunit alcohol dehydrogenase family)